jgi:hypothetical protein
MPDEADSPRALFLGEEGALVPDSNVCSGREPGKEIGEPCPYSETGRMPLPRPIHEREALRMTAIGSPGDLAPPCALQTLGSLAEFLGEAAARYPPGLHPLRVFKCRKLFLLVVPGLRDDRPSKIEPMRH